ncbi:MAG: hypothetical protein ACJAS3_002526, partial [Roseivirga sp.]
GLKFILQKIVDLWIDINLGRLRKAQIVMTTNAHNFPHSHQ